jgi:hypothetical protein
MRGRLIVAALVAVVGLVWMAQGFGLLPGSGFMDGDIRWALGGAALVVAGSLVAVSAWRSGRRSTPS